MTVLIITGTPGTGKTTLAKKLAKKLNYYYLDVNKLILKHKLSEGYDKKRKTKIVDIKRLNKALIKEVSAIKKINEKIQSNKDKPIKNKNSKKIQRNKKIIKSGIIIDSHLSHYLPRKYVDLCVVTKCDLKELERRLKKKKYSENKIRENLDAEIFDICLNEAQENKHSIIVINTTKGININTILEKIGGLVDSK